MSDSPFARDQAQRLMAGMEGLRLDLEELKVALLRLNQHTDQLLTELRATRGAET